MQRKDAELIAVGGGEPARVLVSELLATVAVLSEEVGELKRRLNQNSKNSSKPPSSDPPLSRQQRRALSRERAKRSSRKPGGQPGHEGKSREMALPEKVTERFECLPDFCGGCGENFVGSEREVGEPVVHQVWELPKIEPFIFEYHRKRVICPGCGKHQLADLGAGVSPSAFGPKLEAHIAAFAGAYRLSRSQIADIISEMFRIPISTGAVDATIMRMSAALADPWQQLKEAVREAEVIHADETGWRLGGRQHWLWLAASSLVACYRIDSSRSQKAAKELLGADFGAIAVTDRYSGYHWLDVLQQQLCWAHIIRQLVSISERHGASGKLGRKLLKAAREIFVFHRQYMEDKKDLTWLKTKLSPCQTRLQLLLTQGTRCRDKKTARFCRGLLNDWDALWTFCEIPNIPLTNNPAERALRHAVIMRKVSLGTQSIKGNHWVERILSIRETCRLQKRSILSYLTETAIAAHHGKPAPSPLPP